jgi:molybdate transport system substrate-binding protein
MTRFLAIFIWLLAQIPAALWAEGRVSVFAAASLRGALEDIIAGYDGQVTLSFGGSGTMARQIAAGAPADVVVLASPLWMEWLASQGIIDRNAAVAVAPPRHPRCTTCHSSWTA